jgi:hypothetical protein
MKRLLLTALIVAACGATASFSPSPSTSATPPATSSVHPASPIDGVVVDVERTSLVDVQAFTIRTADGQTYEFRVGSLENAAEFPPSHLNEHMADGVPVRVTFHVEGTALVATHLDDAPAE